MSLKNRMESDCCRCPCHCPSTQDSETAVDSWVPTGDPYVVEFVYFSFFVAVLVVTTYTNFNVAQRQAQRGLQLRTRIRFHGLETRIVSVMILTKRVETTEGRRLLVCVVSPRQTERSARKEACQSTNLNRRPCRWRPGVDSQQVDWCRPASSC